MSVDASFDSIANLEVESSINRQTDPTVATSCPHRLEGRLYLTITSVVYNSALEASISYEFGRIVASSDLRAKLQYARPCVLPSLPRILAGVMGKSHAWFKGVCS